VLEVRTEPGGPHFEINGPNPNNDVLDAAGDVVASTDPTRGATPTG
jgi:hypothetical protein